MSIFGRKIKEEEKLQESTTPTYFSWDQSATGKWSDEDMKWLRDEHPAEMVDPLWNSGRGVQSFALFELVSHGNYRKAGVK